MSRLLLALICLTLASDTWARVVGVVLDDSGSMLNRFETPLYVAQLIISVLDKQDRLFLTRLSENGRIHEIDLDRRQEFMQSMRDHWRVKDGTLTPYGPVEGMLQQLVSVAGRGDDTSLLIITDGEFTEEDLPRPSQLREKYKHLQQRFLGDSLRAFFVAFAPKNKKGDKVLDTIEKQQVRKNLLGAFNGSEDVGSVVVRDGGKLYRALRNIIAQMIGVDPDAASDAIVEERTNLRLRLPVTVTRAVIMASGTERQPPPRLLKKGFKTRDDERTYSLSMRAADNLTTKKLRSNVYDLIPWPPLAPDKEHVLTFDRTVHNADIRILFETSVKVDWEVHDNAGRILPVEQNGVLRLPAGDEVKVNAFLIERIDGQEKRVDFSTLRHPLEFSLHYQGQGPAETGRMVNDNATNTAFGMLRFKRPGRYTVAVTARYPGFINQRARDLRVTVTETAPVDIEVSARGIGVCPHCSAERVDLTYTPDQAYQEVLVIEVRSSSTRKGNYDLKLSDTFPPGVKLVLPDGQTIAASSSRQATLTIESGEPAYLVLQYNGDYAAGAEQRVSLSVQAHHPLEGKAYMELRLAPQTAALELQYAGSTLDPTGKEPFRQKVTSLDQGEGVYVKAVGLLATLSSEHLRLEGDDIPYSIQVQEGTNLILVTPKKLLCDCLTPTGVQHFSIRYHHPVTRQSAEYVGSVEIVSAGLLEQCWRELLALLIAGLILAKVICLFRTRRFPFRARLDKRLADQTWRIAFPKLHGFADWIVPFCHNAERWVDAFHLRAAANGVELLPETYPPDMEYEGETLNSHFEFNGGQPIRLRWGEMIRDQSTDIEYRIIKDTDHF